MAVEVGHEQLAVLATFDEPHEEPLKASLFPTEAIRDRMIVDLLPDSCDDCKPRRVQEAKLLAFFTSRLRIAAAAMLVDDKFPCTHLED